MTTSAKTSPPLSRTRTARTSSTPGHAERRLGDPPIEARRRAIHQRTDVARPRARPRRATRSPTRRAPRSRRRPDVRTAASTSPTSTANDPAKSVAKCHELAYSAALCSDSRGAPGDRRPRRVDRQDEQHERDADAGRVRASALRVEASDRLDRDPDRGADEQQGLGERAEVLRLAMPVLVAPVSGPLGDGDGVQRSGGLRTSRPPSARPLRARRGCLSRCRRRP